MVFLSLQVESLCITDDPRCCSWRRSHRMQSHGCLFTWHLHVCVWCGYSRPAWILSCSTYCEEPTFSRVVGLNDLQKSLQPPWSCWWSLCLCWGGVMFWMPPPPSCKHWRRQQIQHTGPSPLLWLSTFFLICSRWRRAAMLWWSLASSIPLDESHQAVPRAC